MIKASIIIPTLNEESRIQSALESLQRLRQHNIEIIVSDGGSGDETVAFCTPLVDITVNSLKGRARQMNGAAWQASGELLIFLHADTQLPENILSIVDELITKKTLWGFFRVRLSGQSILLRMVEGFMNWRSQTWGTGTGDQTLFIRREMFLRAGGFEDIPLMEDIAFCAQCKLFARPYIVEQCVVTSSRRWEEFGVWRTIWLMWRLRFAYFRGASPQQLAQQYYSGN